MLITGHWRPCADGFVRPVIRGEILAGDGSWYEAFFLVDLGADRTVFTAGVCAALGLTPLVSAERLAGVGGAAGSVILDTQIQLTHETGGKAVFRGQFAAVTDPESLDMSVLGREILNLFAVIVDRQGDVVCLLRPPHRYTITTQG
jgi:hypothetical protein